METADERAVGWADSLRAAGVEPHPALCRRHAYSVDGGRAGMEELLQLDAPPAAVFAASNKLAVGAIQVLVERDLLVTGAAVASLGELPFVTWTPRQVLVTHLPARELGTSAASMLVERIRGLEGPARKVVVPSVADPRGQR